MLQVQNISKFYEKVGVLDKVSIDLNKGEAVGLLGPNGCGKTTLSSIISTLIKPDSGNILYKNRSIYEDIYEFRKKIGFCAQKPNLNTFLTVKENLIYSALHYSFSQKDANTRVKYLIDLLELSDYIDHYPMQLSGGYQQRVMLGRAMMHKPDIIILDEPTVGLDPHVRREVWQIVQNLKSEGVTILLTTHYLDEAEVLSNRVYMMNKGNILLCDTPDELKKKYEQNSLEDVFVKLIKNLEVKSDE